MRWPWSKAAVQPLEEVKDAQFETVLQRLIASQEGITPYAVTPDSCMASPTVHAIVTAISRRLAVTPVHVIQKSIKDGREVKEKLPSHPVAKLLQKPNAWQSRYDFWSDAASVFIRWGRFYAYKSRGLTGPIRELIPLHPQSVELRQDRDYRVEVRVTEKASVVRTLGLGQIFHARGPSRDFLTGDSPVKDVAQAIGLEIMAEHFGSKFFENGAIPLLVFNFQQGSAGFKTEQQEKDFIENFHEAFGGNKKHKGMLVPKGMDKPEAIKFEHDKAQFLETRKYQRTVIAGAFGVPPHLVGDLERATFNNVEQQDQDFTLNVIMPVAQAFEAAMERDLLTDDDRRDGITVRFNLDSVLRADFKSRQEGLNIQRLAGVINADEWREMEGRNPRDDDGGGDYWDQGPSGQGTGNDETESDGSATDQSTE